MVKIIALIKRRPDLSREEFLHHWQVVHPPIVWALPGVQRYVQNPAIDNGRDWPHDGAAELWFESVKDVAVAFDSEAAGPMHEHEKEFIGEISWFLADEIELPAPAYGGKK